MDENSDSEKLEAARQEIYRRRAARKKRIFDLETKVDRFNIEKAKFNETRLAALESARQVQAKIDSAVAEIAALKAVKDPELSQVMA